MGGVLSGESQAARTGVLRANVFYATFGHSALVFHYLKFGKLFQNIIAKSFGFPGSN